MQDSDFQALAEGSGRRGDEQLHVRFYLAPMKDEAESKAKNRPIYRDVPHVEILTPGDPYNILKLEAWIDEQDKNSHSRRFQRQYQAFLQGQTEAVVGTPLDKLPGISASTIEELKHFKVRTIEQLAGLADGFASQLHGGQMFKQRAQAWLDAAAGSAPLEAVRGELEEERLRSRALEERLAALEALARPLPTGTDALQEQAAELAALEGRAEAATRKRGPGRPPKQAE